MSRLAWTLVTLWTSWTSILLASSEAQEATFFEPPRHHAWAGFQPGSWALVRVVSESFDAADEPGKLTTTQTRTTLKEVGEQSVTLLIESTVLLAGREIPSPPQTLEKGFWGDPSSALTVREVTPASPYELPERVVPVQRFEVEVVGPKTRCVHTVDFSAEVSPYILQRHIVCSEARSGGLLYEAHVKTLTLNMPFRFQSQILPSAQVETVQRLSKGKLVTVETYCDSVPGGVVAHWMKELSSDGRLLRHSVLELVQYQIVPPGQQVPAAAEGMETARRAELELRVAPRRLLRQTRRN